MNTFFKRLIRFFSFGIILMVLLIFGYFYSDPFKVLYDHGYFSKSNFVFVNRDYVSTQNFLTNKNKYDYNSFIFGSSRTLGYDPLTWKTYLDKNDVPFVFDASAESLYGMHQKIKYLDTTGVPLKNVLLIICRKHTFHVSSGSGGHLFIRHPEISGESTFDFQLTFFKAYFNINFLISYYTYLITGEFMPFMADYINNTRLSFDPVTNHLRQPDNEKLIEEDPALYYEKYKHYFFRTYDDKGILIKKIILPKEETVDSTPRINKDHLAMLTEIREIFDKHQTNFKVILHPLLDKVKFSPQDLKILKGLYGDNLYDFSGKNEFSSSIKHFYDWNHTRPAAGDKMLSIIYDENGIIK